MFLVTFTYHAPLAEIDRLLDEHRAHLDSQIAAGTLLLAGRLVPRTGGFLLLHGPPGPGRPHRPKRPLRPLGRGHIRSHRTRTHPGPA